MRKPNRVETSKIVLLAATTLLCVGALTLTGCSDDDTTTDTTQESTTTTGKPPSSAERTIAEYLGADPQLSVLATAVAGTPLEGQLGEAGPVTLFAPTNAAFEALPKGTLDDLKATGRLEPTLQLHVAASRLTAAELVPLNGATVDTLGGAVSVKIDGRDLRIGGATVTRTDILTSNGVIHLIDRVITKADG